MQANPVLVETRRDAWVENLHRGAIAVVDADGQVIAAIGDIERAIFPRSAIKSMQALAIFETGAIDRFGVSEEELALACASHHGEEAHVTRVAAFLDRLGLSADALECGAHPPSNATGARGAAGRRARAEPAAQQLLGQACRHAVGGAGAGARPGRLCRARARRAACGAPAPSRR
jgi:L-asparaginase II